MRTALRGSLLAILFCGWSSAGAFGQAEVGGGRLEFLSPPGWFGPGPAWNQWNYPGPGNNWSYYGVANGPFIGMGPNYMGRGYWPGWWGIPGAAGSFWTNGQSLYGPPVPTYGPTPGVFSNSDAHKQFFKNPPPANGVWFGLGWTGSRSPSPRFAPVNVSVYPRSVQVVPAPPATKSDGSTCVRLVIRLPDANADVWVEKTEMKGQGTERHFESPTLVAGKEYQYELVARWRDQGQEKAESRTITCSAGQTISVDFTKPILPTEMEQTAK